MISAAEFIRDFLPPPAAPYSPAPNLNNAENLLLLWMHWRIKTSRCVVHVLKAENSFRNIYIYIYIYIQYIYIGASCVVHEACPLYIRWRQPHHFSAYMWLRLNCPSSPCVWAVETEIQSKSRKMDGGLAVMVLLQGGRWKPECPVVRQVAERSDAIVPGGVCSVRLCSAGWALLTAASLR